MMVRLLMVVVLIPAISSIPPSGWRGPICPASAQVAFSPVFGSIGSIRILPLEGIGDLGKYLARSDTDVAFTPVSSSSLHFGILPRHGCNPRVVFSPGSCHGHLLLAKLGRNTGPTGFHLPQTSFQGDDADVIVKAGRRIVRASDLHVTRSGVRISRKVARGDHAGDAGGAEQTSGGARAVVRGEGGDVDHGVGIEMVAAIVGVTGAGLFPMMPAAGRSGLLLPAVSFVLCEMRHVEIVVRRIDLDERHRCDALRCVGTKQKEQIKKDYTNVCALRT